MLKYVKKIKSSTKTVNLTVHVNYTIPGCDFLVGSGCCVHFSSKS